MVTEPHLIPVGNSNWLGSKCGLAVVVACLAADSLPCSIRKRADSYVAIDYGPVTVVGVYLPHYRNKQGRGKLARIEKVLGRTWEALKAAIKEAKEKAWERLVDSLDEDPWGRPYKRTVGKIRPWAPPPTESMDPQDLEGRLDTFFPRVEESPPRLPVPELRDGNWNEDLGVSLEEFATARKKLGAKGKAPGPDGIPGRAWALALGEGNLSAATRDVLEKCLKEGVFPHKWRRAKLVLLPKESKTPGGAPGGAPAFRPICLLDEAGKILERIIANCLVQHMSLEGPDLHSNQYGFRPGRSMLDAVQRVRDLARAAVEEGGRVLLAVSLDITNAFNTLPWPEIGRALEYHGVSVYLRRILSAYFRDRYLAYSGRGGVQGWRRMEHGVPQGRLAPRVRKMSTALAGLMRTQGGPGWRARRLYVGVVHSVALYGAPIWAPRLLATGRNKNLIRQAMRPVVMRAIRGEEGLSVRDLRALKAQACVRTLDKWSAELADPRGFGRWTAEAVRPCLSEMMGRRGRGLSFHLVQVLTGHGCFGKYLHRIRKEPTAGCHHCPERVDSAQHTGRVNFEQSNDQWHKLQNNGSNCKAWRNKGLNMMAQMELLKHFTIKML
ncbi:uncharacterized protein LOC112589898 [Harpegnathos saltator]|uniref:uncharacterized protein LOC112589898 n=1 Tax=Harpegnathos saltator TaxID=610380 RepID=UPI000DBEECA4|nr:uncharacterized protein LOC112589898 [Harpegnathos saltator]